MAITDLPAIQDVKKGVALVMLATLLFAASDVLGKHLAVLHAVPFIMAVRYIINAGLLVAILGPAHGAGLWCTQRTGLVILRGLCLAAASLTMGLALRVMPVGETVAIIYLAPFVVMLVAGRFMDETVTRTGWAFALCGFAGVLLIVRPGSGLDPVGVVLCLINVGFAAAYQLLTRSLARTETMPAMVFITALVGIAVFVPLSLFTGPGQMPDTMGWLLLTALGVLATAGHLLFTSAYREAPAATLAPVNYLHLVWAGLLGWGVFSHTPDRIALVGMVVVALSGVVLATQAGRGPPRPTE